MAIGSFAQIPQLAPRPRSVPAMPLDSLIQGFQQGNTLVNLPQILSEQEAQKQNALLNQLLENQLLQLRVEEARNPSAAMARQLGLRLSPELADPTSGIVTPQAGLTGITVANPGTVTPQLQAALEGATAITAPTAGNFVAARGAETPIAINGIQTGLNLNRANIPAPKRDVKEVDGSLAEFNPATGKYETVYTAPSTAKAVPPVLFTNGTESIWVQPNSPIPAGYYPPGHPPKAGEKGELTRDALGNPFWSEGKTLTALPKPPGWQSKAGEGSSDATTAYATERSDRVLGDISALKSRVSPYTTGFGSLLSVIPTTESRDFKADVDSLKASIAFGELAEMRAASKTGGALGAVSNKELNLLESAQGSLDAGQSPANFTKNLDKIEASINRWRAAKAQQGGSTGGGKITREQAASILQEAGGDKNRARELARQRGLSF